MVAINLRLDSSGMGQCMFGIGALGNHFKFHDLLILLSLYIFVYLKIVLLLIKSVNSLRLFPFHHWALWNLRNLLYSKRLLGEGCSDGKNLWSSRVPLSNWWRRRKLRSFSMPPQYFLETIEPKASRNRSFKTIKELHADGLSTHTH